MSYKLKPEHKTICEKIKKFRTKNKEEKSCNYFLLEEPIFEFILKQNISTNEKLLLLFFIKKVDYSFNHLFVYAPYQLIKNETGISKSTTYRALNNLDQRGLIKFHSGTQRLLNMQVKELMFKQKQKINPKENQENIIEMTPLYKQFFDNNK